MSRLVPPKGVPDANTLADSEELEQLGTQQLQTVRAHAEQWRTVLIALLGVVPTLSFIGGPDAVKDLHTEARYAIGVLLVVSMASGGLATWIASSAAVGTLRSVVVSDVAAIGLDLYRANLAEEALAKLKIARILTALSVGLIVLAVAVMWLSPVRS
jgi:hypothetical protein